MNAENKTNPDHSEQPAQKPIALPQQLEEDARRTARAEARAQKMIADNVEKSIEKAQPAPAKPAEHGDKVPRMRDLDKDIESEMAAALGMVSDKELYGEPTQHRKRTPPAPPGTPKPKGKVISIHGQDVFIEVPGGRSQGVLPINQFTDEPPTIGMEVDVTIEGYDPANGLLILTRQGAVIHADWSTVTRGMIVEARVTGTNKGGLEVDVNSIRGFLPISQIELYRVENLDQYLNQRLRCVVTEADQSERNLVVSRRDLLEQEREEAKEKLWLELAEGQIRDGVVRSVQKFGAFVDLGGVDGLVHVSEMAWTRVADPSQVVQPGQKVKVVVLKLDRETRKVGLGLRQLTQSPWDNLQERYPHNSIVKGKVTRTAEFGAFVELEPGVEGLIHVSELSPQRVYRVTDVVKVDQEVDVKILEIDESRRRLSLSLKAAAGAAKAAEAAPTPEPEEEEVPQKPARPRTTPLRGGTSGFPGAEELQALSQRLKPNP